MPRAHASRRPFVVVSVAAVALVLSGVAGVRDAQVAGADTDLANVRLGLAPITGALASPVAIASRTGDPRLYVAQQGGAVKIVDPATGAIAGTALTLTGIGTGGERGLLGLAFSPDGTKLYVFYTLSSGTLRVAEYVMAGDVAQVGTARELLSKALESVCISLHHEEVLIVAAAGNDGKPGSHYGARNPAAYESVLGVGALVPDAGAPSGYAMAFYSNDSDDPLSAGIATLGGDADPMTYDTRPDSGVLGVYTGEFPQAGALPNPNGWAWWAGTSFAAPVITGALPAIIGNNRPPAQAQPELRDCVEAPGTMPNLEIFPVRQEP